MKWFTIPMIMIILISTYLIASPNQPDERVIGYELLENNSILHIWNVADDYYFNATSGIQFTNNYNEYWTHNIFCGGVYYQSSWEYYCNNELPFEWSISTDNETYVNVTGYRDVTKNVDGKDYIVRFALRYHLKTEDTFLTIQPYEKNIGSYNIPIDTGFAWRINDIKINNDFENDWIYINDTQYWLNETLDLAFNNLTNSEIFMHDDNSGKWLWINWSNTLNNRYWIQSSPYQYNSPNTLLINAGSLNINQQKTTTFGWIDATCTWHCNYLTPVLNPNIETGSTYSHTASITYDGTCTTSGSVEAQYQDSTIGSSWTKILSSGTNLTTTSLNPQTIGFCFLGTCGPYSWTIKGEEDNTDEGNYGTRDYCTFNGGKTLEATGPSVTITDPSSESRPCNYTTISHNTTLTSSQTGQCYNITTSGVVFDCASYILNGNGTILDNFTIFSTNTANITIKNCILKNWVLGVKFDKVNNSIIKNITLFNVSDLSSELVVAKGIYLETSYNNIIDKVNITKVYANSSSTSGCYDGSSVIGLDIKNSRNNSFINSRLINVKGYQQGVTTEGCNDGIRVDLGKSIYIYNSSYTTIFNSTISMGLNGINTESIGDSSYLNISRNTIRDFLTSSSYFDCAVDLNYISDNSMFYHNNLINNTNNFITLSDYNNVTYNYISGGENGIEFCKGVGCFGGNIEDNYIEYTHNMGDDEAGIYIKAITFGDFNNNTLFNTSYNGSNSGTVYTNYIITGTGNNLTNCTWCFYLDSQADNSQIYNTTIKDIFNYSIIVETAGSNMSFFNSTFNKTLTNVSGTGTFFNYYPLIVNITNSSYTPVSNAQLNIKDNFNNFFSRITDSNGLSTKEYFLEFNETSTSKTYLYPYNVTVWKDNYISNYTIINLDSSKIINIILPQCWIKISRLLSIPVGCQYKFSGVTKI